MKQLSLFLLVLIFAGSVSAIPEALQKVQIGKQAVYLEIADEVNEITHGLSDRTELATDNGMVFVFPDTTRRTFWMYRCWFDIDVAFVAPNGRIRDIQRMVAEPLDTPPEALKTYPSHASDIKYVIEMNAGWFAQHGIKVGDSTDVWRFKPKTKPGEIR